MPELTSPRTGWDRLRQNLGRIFRKKGRVHPEKFQFGEKISEGGMGWVYAGTQTNLNNRKVAIKVPKNIDARELFTEEWDILAGLDEPNIVSIYDSGERTFEDGVKRPFFVMPFLEGQTLQEGAPDPNRIEDIVFILRRVCKGLAAIHAKDIVHCDIKPSNIFIKNKSEVLVIDFGLATKVKDGVGRSRGGTTRYLSPEQISTRSIDCRSDIFSLGVIAYQLLSGTYPFNDERERLKDSICRDIPEPLFMRNPQINEALALVVHKALAKSPMDRPASARDFEKMLDRAARRSEIPPALDESVVAEDIQSARKLLLAGNYEKALKAVLDLQRRGFAHQSTIKLHWQIEAAIRDQELESQLTKSATHMEDFEFGEAHAELSLMRQVDAWDYRTLRIAANLECRERFVGKDAILREARGHSDDHQNALLHSKYQYFLLVHSADPYARNEDPRKKEVESLAIRHSQAQKNAVADIQKLVSRGHLQEAYNTCQKFSTAQPGSYLLRCAHLDLERTIHNAVEAATRDDTDLGSGNSTDEALALLTTFPNAGERKGRLETKKRREALFDQISKDSQRHEEAGDYHAATYVLEVLSRFDPPPADLATRLTSLSEKKERRDRERLIAEYRRAIEFCVESADWDPVALTVKKACDLFPEERWFAEQNVLIQRCLAQSQKAKGFIASAREAAKACSYDEELDLLKKSCELEPVNPVAGLAYAGALAKNAARTQWLNRSRSDGLLFEARKVQEQFADGRFLHDWTGAEALPHADTSLRHTEEVPGPNQDLPLFSEQNSGAASASTSVLESELFVSQPDPVVVGPETPTDGPPDQSHVSEAAPIIDPSFAINPQPGSGTGTGTGSHTSNLSGPETGRTARGLGSLVRRYRELSIALGTILAIVGVFGIVSLPTRSRQAPPPVPENVNTTRAVEFVTDPPNAQLFIDGSEKPKRVKLRPGKYSIQAKAPGCLDSTLETRTIEAGQGALRISLNRLKRRRPQLRLIGGSEGQFSMDDAVMVEASEVATGSHKITWKGTKGAATMTLSFNMRDLDYPSIEPIKTQGIEMVAISRFRGQTMVRRSDLKIRILQEGRILDGPGPHELSEDQGRFQIEGVPHPFPVDCDGREAPALCIVVVSGQSLTNITVTTGVPNIKVLYNNAWFGNTFGNGQLAQGVPASTYTFSIDSPEYTAAPIGPAIYKAGESKMVALKLVPRPGILAIPAGVPVGTGVWIDGKSAKVVSTVDVPSELEVAVGEHKIELRKEGFRTVTITRAFKRGGREVLTPIEVALTPLAPAKPVVVPAKEQPISSVPQVPNFPIARPIEVAKPKPAPESQWEGLEPLPDGSFKIKAKEFHLRQGTAATPVSLRIDDFEGVRLIVGDPSKQYAEFRLDGKNLHWKKKLAKKELTEGKTPHGSIKGLTLRVSVANSSVTAEIVGGARSDAIAIDPGVVIFQGGKKVRITPH